MNVNEIVTLVEGKIVEGEEHQMEPIDQVFASDLMSDVLTIEANETIMLITGLANMQTIRTCEMSDIRIILFVRGKKATDEMIELARENNMILIETDYSLFRASGILYNAGVKPVY